MKASLVILNGLIITMNPRSPFVEAIAIYKDQILALGSNEEIINLIDLNTKVINAKDKIVLPGFIDCHVHLMQTGIDLMKIDFSACTNIAKVEELIRENLYKIKSNQWILGIGYNEFNLEKNQMISLKELDRIVPNNPVWISRVDHHSGIINSLALNRLNIPQTIDGLEKDEEDGELTGFVYGQANSYVRQSINKILDKTSRKEAVHKAVNSMLSVGITSVHALEGGSLFLDEDIDIILEEKPILPIDIKLFYQTTNVKKVIEKGLKQIGGCLLIDGSLGSRTAALSEPYKDAPNNYGNLYFDSKDLEEFILEAHMKDLLKIVH